MRHRFNLIAYTNRWTKCEAIKNNDEPLLQRQDSRWTYKTDNCEVFWRSIGKGVLFKTFDVKVQLQNVPELWRQSVEKFTPFPYRTSAYSHGIYDDHIKQPVSHRRLPILAHFSYVNMLRNILFRNRFFLQNTVKYHMEKETFYMESQSSLQDALPLN